MKKLLWLFLFLFCVALCAQAEENIYPWNLNMFVGGASLCDEFGCFGPTGLSVGASFGRPMGDRWSFELEGAYARTNEILSQRFDISTQTFYTPELTRGRVWGGGTFLAKMANFGSGDFHIAIGFVAGYEQKKEKTPLGILITDRGLRGGISGGAGMNYWFSESWAIRPELRYYAVADELSGLRYTVGIVKKF